MVQGSAVRLLGFESQLCHWRDWSFGASQLPFLSLSGLSEREGEHWLLRARGQEWRSLDGTAHRAGEGGGDSMLFRSVALYRGTCVKLVLWPEAPVPCAMCPRKKRKKRKTDGDTHPLPGQVCLELGLWVSSLVLLTICCVTLDQWLGLSLPFLPIGDPSIYSWEFSVTENLFLGISR